MKDQRKALKVKIKSLAAEARIIRLEEKRAMPRLDATLAKDHRGVVVLWQRGKLIKKYADLDLYCSLREHRIRDVRREARCSLLAYAYIRGKPFSHVEKPITCRIGNPDWQRVQALVEKFGGRPGFKRVCSRVELLEWVDGKTHPVS